MSADAGVAQSEVQEGNGPELSGVFLNQLIKLAGGILVELQMPRRRAFSFSRNHATNPMLPVHVVDGDHRNTTRLKCRAYFLFHRCSALGHYPKTRMLRAGVRRVFHPTRRPEGAAIKVRAQKRTAALDAFGDSIAAVIGVKAILL